MAVAKSLRIFLTMLSVLCLFAGYGERAQAGGGMRQRVQRMKESTVRILVNGAPAGTGFAVAEKQWGQTYTIDRIITK